MNEIEQLLELNNKGHNRLSRAAKFWVLVAMLSVGIPVLLIFIILIAAACWK